MDQRTPAIERRILLFGQTNLENSILIGNVHQNTGIECQLIDVRHWRAEWECEADRMIALIDSGSAAPERIRELVDCLHDLQADIGIAVFNVAKRHPSEQLISWPKLNGLFYTGTPHSQLCRGIENLFLGELWLPRHLMAAFLERTRERPKNATGFAGILTRREKQILRLTATGATNAEVAEALNVSMHTVKTHVYNLFRKIGVTNRIQAVNWAKENMHELHDKEEVEATG